MAEDWLVEHLKTIKNLCQIALLLRGRGRNELLPTILEFLYQEAQEIIDENCIEDEQEHSRDNSL